MLVVGEILKIVKSRAIRIVLAILVAANAAAVLYQVSAENAASPVPPDALDGAWEQFRANPGRVLARFDELERFYEAREQSMAAENGGRGAFTALAAVAEEKAADGEYLALSQIRAQVDAAVAFPETVLGVIRQAEINRDLYLKEQTRDSGFGLQYQERVIRQYSGIQINVRLGVDDLRGWETYFRSPFTGIAAVFAAVLTAGAAAGIEYDTNAAPLLFSTKNGRRRRKAARMLAADGTVVLFVLLAEAETFGLVALTRGFGWGGNAVQALSAFRTCPYVLTIAQTAAIRLGVRFLFALVLGTLTQLLADLCRSGAAAAAGGILCAGASTALALRAWGTGSGAASLLRLAAAAPLRAPFPFFERLQAVRLFGMAEDGLTAASVCLGILLAGFAAADLAVFLRPSGSPLTGRMKAARSAVREKLRLHGEKRGGRSGGSVSLLPHELYKTWIASRAVWLLILLLAVYGVQTVRGPSADRSYYAEVYDRYVDSVRGEWTAEKEAAIREKADDARAIVGRRMEVLDAYLAGDMTREEYHDYTTRYGEAYLELPALEALEEYLAVLRQRKEDGHTVSILNDTRWSAVFRRGVDWTAEVLTCALALASFGEYTKNDRNDISPIRSCARYGRRRTRRVKTLAGLAACAAIFTLQRAAWLSVSAADLPREDLAAPLLSLRLMDWTARLGMGSLPLSSGLALFGAVQCAYVMLLFLFLSGCLMKMKNKYAALAASLPLIFAPFWVSSVLFR